MLYKSHKSDAGGFAVDLHEVGSELGLDATLLRKSLKTLKRYGLISEPDIEDECEVCHIVGFNDWDSIWEDIKSFCKSERIELDDIVMNMDFSVFDEQD